MVHCWHTRVDRCTDTAFDQLLVSLAPTLQRDVLRFIQPADRKRKLLGRLLLKQMLAEHRLGTLDNVSLSEHGKPLMHIGPAFNISHSGNYVVMAFCLEPGISIGVDIQEMSFTDCREMAPLVYCQEELDYLQRIPELYVNRFYDLWAKKEAILKADGQGFIRDPKQVNCLSNSSIDGIQYWFHEVKVDERYKSYIASTDSIRIIEVVEKGMDELRTA